MERMPSFEPPSGIHKKVERTKKTSLEEAAKSHPDYAKFEALLNEVDKPSEEDALEHVETAYPEALASAMSELYWYQKLSGKDATDFGNSGNHDKKPIEFAHECGISVDEARQIFIDARHKVEDAVKKIKRNHRLSETADTFFLLKDETSQEIEMLREEVSQLRKQLREAA